MIVEICDDRRGLDIAYLRTKFLEREGREPQSDDEAAVLIFESGVSTKEAVSEISGREVGMDVVRSEIREMHGSIDLKLLESSGSRRLFAFEISIPLHALAK